MTNCLSLGTHAPAWTNSHKATKTQALGWQANAAGRPEGNHRAKQNQISHAKFKILLNIKAK